MDLGDFSVSLAVKNLEASLAFYQNLDFDVIGGEREQGWLILKNDKAKIGLFQGMFEGNILTFHPRDVRGIQKRLKAAGTALESEADETTSGPASAMLRDPDGNAILLDQG